MKVNELRWYNQSPVIFLDGVTDRSAAESLIKAILLVEQPSDQLPEEPDAWYDHQLSGLAVVRDGIEIGKVIRVDHLPAQDLLAIDFDGAEVLLPFVKAFVPEVNVQAGKITITPPLGLFEPDQALLAISEGGDENQDQGTQG